MAVNRNEVVDIGGRDLFGGGVSSEIYQGNLTREGQPIGVFYGYALDGLINDQEEADAYAGVMPGVVPGEAKIVDVNGDGVITPDDRTVIGNPWPDFTYGWSNTFAYGDFDLYVFLQGSVGNDVFNLDKYDLGSAAGAGHNLPVDVFEDRWTPEHKDAKYPILATPRTGYAGPGNGQIQDLFIEDASYLRVKTVTLGYNLPPTLTGLGRLGFRSARVYVSGTNLLTFTGYSGTNPDVNTQGQSNLNRGVDIGGYPMARTYQVGVRLGL